MVHFYVMVCSVLYCYDVVGVVVLLLLCWSSGHVEFRFVSFRLCCCYVLVWIVLICIGMVCGSLFYHFVWLCVFACVMCVHVCCHVWCVDNCCVVLLCVFGVL